LGLFIRKHALDSHALAIVRMQLFSKPDAHKLHSHRNAGLDLRVTVDLAERKIVGA
jgi:hypothetical protein